jgi:hypothetical protein
MTEKIKSLGAALVTLVTAALTIWWLYEVASRLGVAPTKDDAGNIVLDEFQRAKDILIVVLPLFSAALAYWVGSQGTTAAKEEAASAKGKLDAVLDASPEGILKKAKDLHPTAFGSN